MLALTYVCLDNDKLSQRLKLLGKRKCV